MNCPDNKAIRDNLILAYRIINNEKYQHPVVAISGGADSDVMLDICYKCDKDKKITYVWFDTGIEYQATKDHIIDLKKEYGIEIVQYKAIKAVPTSCKQYGQPFISKQVSDYMKRLQAHNFQWEDDNFENLITKYPRCKSALQWWCCCKGENSRFNITQNRWLKEFIIENPPQFKISDNCCKYAKKNVLLKTIKENGYDLSINGVRKAEGGVRATAYKSCFDESGDNFDNYRPLFWYSNQDRREYENYYGISHSRCYTEYGLKRTGCVGCPYNRNLETELEVVQKYEPKLYKAICNIFKDSYEYTRMYREFCKKKKEEK